MPLNELDLNDLAGQALSAPEPEPESGSERDAPRTRRTRSDKGQPRTAGRQTAASRKLAKDLLSPLAKLAKGLAFVAPTAAAVLIEDGERTANALVQIAERHPAMLKALQAGSQFGPATDLLETAIKVVFAFSLDMGRITPEHPLAAILGVTKLYRETHPADGNPDGLAGNVNGFVPPPPPGPVLPTDPRHPMYSWQAS